MDHNKGNRMNALVLTPVRETARFDGPLHWTRMLEFAYAVDEETMRDMATGRPLLLAYKAFHREAKTWFEPTTTVADLCIVPEGTVDGARFERHIKDKSRPEDAERLIYYHGSLLSIAFHELGYLPGWSTLAVDTMVCIYNFIGRPVRREDKNWSRLLDPIVNQLGSAVNKTPSDKAGVRENMTVRARCIGSLRRISVGLGTSVFESQLLGRSIPYPSMCYVCGSKVEGTITYTGCLVPRDRDKIASLSCRHEDHIKFELEVMK